jgi:hypothetical protein
MDKCRKNINWFCKLWVFKWHLLLLTIFNMPAKGNLFNFIITKATGL